MKQLLHDLATVAPLQQQWELVWGPTLYKLPIGLLDDNMWYVVRNVATGEYAIGIRGTNADAILDWIVEDFWITSQVRWPYGGTPGLVPKIADGTSFASTSCSISCRPWHPGSGHDPARYLTTQTRTRAIHRHGHRPQPGRLPVVDAGARAQGHDDPVEPAFTPTVRSWSFAGRRPGMSTSHAIPTCGSAIPASLGQ